MNRTLTKITKQQTLEGLPSKIITKIIFQDGEEVIYIEKRYFSTFKVEPTTARKCGELYYCKDKIVLKWSTFSNIYEDVFNKRSRVKYGTL